MSKQEKANPAAAPETTAESVSGATNINQIRQILELDVGEHIEKKNNLSYLSWAWAWATALKADPNASFKVRTWEGKCWMDVHGTAIVWVDVTMFGKTQECFLPVMDHRNKPIPEPDAFQVNTALMRCLTKCLALFGLGLYIYAGEDLPHVDKPALTDSEKADLELFADGIVEYVVIATSSQGLKSYWKSNQTKLDDLKEKMPAQYERVLNVFRDRKAQLEGEKSE